MNSVESNRWYEDNRQYLATALSLVKQALINHAQDDSGKDEGPDRGKRRFRFKIPFIGRSTSGDAKSKGTQAQALEKEMDAAVARMSAPPALQTICKAFSLSPFERDVLLLCAGMELEPSIAQLCAGASGDASHPYSSFGLALAAFEQSHWSALAPDAPLRYWRLIETEPNQGLTTGRLRIDERILHALTGVKHLDERLASMVVPVTADDNLARSLKKLADQIALTWKNSPPKLPLIVLSGRDPVGQRLVAEAACQQLELGIYRLSLHALPDTSAERTAFMRLWEREVVLSRCVLLLDAWDADAGNPQTVLKARELLEALPTPLMIMSREPYRTERRTAINLLVGNPDSSEQKTIWKNHLAAARLKASGDLDKITRQFDFSEAEIEKAVAVVLAQPLDGEAISTQTETNALVENLWHASRTVARPELGSLAMPIDPVAKEEDLVLPDPQRHLLDQIVATVRQHRKVFETWGFIEKSSRGLGIGALFVGPSGTGKTMAAEVIAKRLDLDLYRIDLSAVVSKYIGETEKNLRRIFDVAESGSMILLFDEADALFGKRSEVRDSHDRYANIEISYLLQKMEAYRGLAILTSNMGDAIDSAFLRRLRFIVRFPLPSAADRLKIWKRVWPDNVPREVLDYQHLAQLNVTGGNIRNIALQAAFLAAEDGESVSMNHLRSAATAEYTKLEKNLTTGEKRGWM